MPRTYAVLSEPKTAADNAERLIVHFLLTKPGRADAVFHILKDPVVIRNPVLRPIVAAAIALYEDGLASNIINVGRRLEKDEKQVRLPEVLADCTAAGGDFGDAVAAESAAALVVEQFNLERAKATLKTADDWPTVVEAARKVLDIDAGVNPDMVPTPAEICKAIIVKQTAIYAGTVEAGYSWGLDRLDSHTRLELSKFYVAGGLKKCGKTHLAIHMLDHNLRKGVPCCLFTLEMTLEEIYRRLLAKRTGVNSWNILSKGLLRSDFTKIEAECKKIAGGPFPLYADDSPNLTVLDLTSRARRWKYNTKAEGGIICVDFLQLVRQERQRGDSEASAIKAIAYELARCAKDLGVAILAVAQLNNTAEGTEPHIRYLEGSGAIAQSAQAILLVDNVRRRDPKRQNKDGLSDVNILIAEQRSGESGLKVPCKVDFKTSTFYDVAPKYRQAPMDV